MESHQRSDSQKIEWLWFLLWKTRVNHNQQSELLDTTEFSGAIKPFLARAVETENPEPTFSRYCFDPIGFLSYRCFRAEVQISAAVGIFHHARIPLVVLAWEY